MKKVRQRRVMQLLIQFKTLMM